MRFIASHTPLPPGTAAWPNTHDVLVDTAATNTLPAIALQFPKWTDGRAYSQAALLRMRLGYRGELLATGDVLADMLPLLRRCGFTAVQLRADQAVEDAQRALGWFDGLQHPHTQRQHYQVAASDPATATR